MNIKAGISFDVVNDPIKTEQLIYEQIFNHNFNVPYVAMPIAFSINNIGINKTQEIIDKIESQYPFKKFYVCQHILVNKLNFYDNLVFTPHTEKNDKFLFIPHYNPLYNKKPIYTPTEDRKILMSFMGDFNSHPTRQKIGKIKHESVLIMPTNTWHFYLPPEKQLMNKNNYLTILGKSKLSLCPRGTGPSTLRFFESLSNGSVPIIFNDLKIPNEIDDYIYKFDIEQIDDKNFFDHFNEEDISKRSKFLFNYYWDCLSNHNLSYFITKHIKSL